MTKEEVKKIEDQIRDLESQKRQFYQDERAKELLEVEQKYLGRMYKKTSDNGGAVYMRVVSAINVNAPYNVQCFEFEIPVRVKFQHASYLHPFRNLRDAFDFMFDGEPFVYYDEELVKDLEEKYEEVSMQDFQNTFEIFCDELRKLATTDFTLEEKFGGEYVQKIMSQKEEE